MRSDSPQQPAAATAAHPTKIYLKVQFHFIDLENAKIRVTSTALRNNRQKKYEFYDSL